MDSLLAPPPLRAGDQVRMVAPGGFVAPEVADRAASELRSWGLVPTVGAHALRRHHRFAAPDASRLADLQTAFDDPDVRAVLALRGGYGTARIIDDLDLMGFLAAPKWAVGFSDLTVLLTCLGRWGYQALHATMPVMFDAPGAADALASLKHTLFGGEVDYREAGHLLNRAGRGRGLLVGGTLSLLCDGIGTATDVATEGKILFLEDVGEPLYKVDRMVRQLQRAGRLRDLTGLIVGHFTDLDAGDPPFGATVEEIVAEVVGAYAYPVAYGFPVGHVGRNLALPCGREAELTVGRGAVRLKTGGSGAIT
ncbi:MAG: LD-carboxypeptidase [Catalinimonas sp.]